MVKKKTTIGILLAAGALVSVGTGALQYQMSQVQASRQVSTIVRKVSDTGKSVLVTNKRADIKKETEPKVLLEGKGIYIPESAKYEEEDEWGHQILWNGYNICYSKDGIEEKESDLSIGDAILIARDTLLDYGKNDVSNATTIQISLEKNDYINEIIDKSVIDNIKYYGIRYYYIYFINDSEDAEHDYTVKLNAVTGEVLAYSDFCNVEGSQLETYSQELESAEDIYYPLAKTFIQKKLQLGKVEKCYGVMQKMMPINRPSVLFHCETENGDLVKISFDQEQKIVNMFEINPLLNDKLD